MLEKNNKTHVFTVIRSAGALQNEARRATLNFWKRRSVRRLETSRLEIFPARFEDAFRVLVDPDVLRHQRF